MSTGGGRLTLLPVERPAASDAFLRLPWAIYRGDPAWVPPLLLERREHLDPRKNPFFENADACFWLALRDGRPVGRISAQVNRAHLERHGDATGHFGMLEAEDDPTVFQALLGAAEDWLRERGMQRVRGPFNLSINEDCGLLVEGFEHPPSMLMSHARPYYAQRLEALGYTKAKDLICYHYQTDRPPRPLARLLRKAETTKDLVIRPLDFRRYEADLSAIMDVFNDAWSENWGFVPMSQAELRHMANALKPIVRPQSIAIAELAGRAVAMSVGLPNVNEAIADLDGRLLPFGWAKLLWRLKVKTPKSSRVPLMGVRREFHGTMLGAALAVAVNDRMRRGQRALGVETSELSWILEDNVAMRRMAEDFGSVAYKTYRIYERDLRP